LMGEFHPGSPEIRLKELHSLLGLFRRNLHAAPLFLYHS
jgi:hypothetical protein